MGDSQNQDLWVSFESRLKLKFCGSQVTTDAGLLAYRELDAALGLTELGGDMLSDSRQDRNKQHQLVPLLRQSICFGVETRPARNTGGRCYCR
jgi:hypothetical protein